ncbi:hypothetical protein [Sulfitobacter aestuariivivens]|uniref:Uncharacterized protein n=1 Tax=Sulfitobacter aestuariivivens TaxID=2766981 RepID=A0A927HDS1_9RHOB|nr:hypothetical protein [Sulfitobacter aestuariivivens]MBD3664012.1 hypothetical protein [Sulfitobacter aestuariivivens]
MRALRTLLTVAFTVMATGALAANLTSGVQDATQFCLGYLQTGQASDALLRKGFTQKRKGFEKSFGRDLLLGRKNNVHVSLRNGGGMLECHVKVGSGGVKALNGFLRTAQETVLAQGFRRAQMTDSRGRQVDVLQKSGVAVTVSAKSTSATGSISSLLVFKRAG